MIVLKKCGAILFSLFLILVVILTFIIPKATSVANPLTEIIFIDPGHGGKDDGASYGGITEDEINLHIASYLYEACLNEKINCYIARSGDYDLASLYATNRKREDLKKRADLINSLGVDIFISIHLNAFYDASVKGPMVYYRPHDEASKQLATFVQNELNDFTASTKNISTDNYYLFRYTKATGILVECGFLSNEQERNKLYTASYQKHLAETILKGLNKFTLSLEGL